MIDTQELRRLARNDYNHSARSCSTKRNINMIDLNDTKHERDKLSAELETERMRLAVCNAANLEYFEGFAEEYTSASLDDEMNLRKQLEAAEKERDALRAKIKEMERQPVFVWYDDESGETFTVGSIEDGVDTSDSLRPLYALPGAKGEAK